MPTLEFKGKPFVYSHHLSVPFRELIVDKDKSLPPKGEEPGLDGNLIIHGDNLEALKALLPRYAGKVDVIYIDPPYNTGNEGWAYNDNVNAPQLKAWLGKVVDADDLERHDKWLSMMWPRLQLLKELLAEDGSLWVTIDDNEDQRLRQILDEVFAESGYISEIAWKHSDSSSNNVTQFSQDYNTIFVYSKNSYWQPNFLDDPSKRKHFKNPDNDPKGAWYDGADIQNPAIRPNLQFDLKGPAGMIKHPPNGWRWSRETMEEKFATGELRFSNDGKRVIRRTYLSEQKGLPPSSLWADVTKTGHTRGAKNTLKHVFGDDYASDLFSTPKPVQLIEHILALAGDLDSLVMDSFAGSGTTAHAVLALNKADGGNRKFILIETEDYADTLTAERVRRVIKGIRTSKDPALKEGLGGSFTYCDLGEPMDLERFFAGEGKAPERDAVARYVAWTATGETLSPANGPDGFIGHAGHYRLHLLYKPNAKWMRSNEAMLDLTTAERIAEAAKADGGNPTLVFAAGKLMGQRALTGLGLTFCQLPYSVHRILGEGIEGVAGVDAA